MLHKQRDKRIAEYRKTIEAAHDLPESSRAAEILAELEVCRDNAATAGDEDFRLLCEAEILRINKGMNSRCVKLLEKAVNWTEQHSHPCDSWILQTLGHYYYQLHDMASAIEWYQRAVEVNPEDYELMQFIGLSFSTLYGSDGDQVAAVEWFDRALQAKPDDSETKQFKVRSLAKMGKTNEAVALCDEVLAASPDDKDTHICRQFAVGEIDETDMLLALSENELERDPSDCDCMRGIGNIHASRGDFKKAIEWYDKALETKPHHIHAMCCKAAVLADSGDYDSALEWFDRALAEDPCDLRALSQKGAVLYCRKELDAALEILDKALDLNPKDWSSLRNKGAVLSAMDKPDEAERYYLAALEQNPDDAGSLRQLAYIEFKREHRDKAFELLRKAVMLDPEHFRHDFRDLCRATGRSFRREWGNLFPSDPLFLSWRWFVRLFGSNSGWSRTLKDKH